LIATLVAGTGNTLSALVEYYLGTHVANITNFMERKEKLPWGLSKVKVDSPLFLIGARMVPGVGPKFVSITAGIYRVPFLLYLWTSAVSVFLGAVVFALGGSGLGSLFVKK
jgi:membrane protein YqaA with SNARE-associated domain